jgi:hypothetical protein
LTPDLDLATAELLASGLGLVFGLLRAAALGLFALSLGVRPTFDWVSLVRVTEALSRSPEHVTEPLVVPLQE